MDFGKLQKEDGLRLDGVRVPLEDGAWIKVRHSRSRPVQDARREAEKKLRRSKGYIVNKDLSELETLEVIREALVEAGVIDWGGFRRDGQDVPFSKDELRTWLGISTFEEQVRTLCNDDSLFSLENLEAVAGN